MSAKRKPEVTSLDKENICEETDDPNKKLKLGIPSNDSNSPDVELTKDENGIENHSVNVDKHREHVEEDEDDEDEGDYEDEEEEEEDEEEDDSDDEDSNGNPKIVDRKGKGIMRDAKGKGKLVEESEDSSDCGSESDADSDLSDDPLAEVDLDNILPSRTRRRVVQPGVYISTSQGTKENEDDDSGDRSS